MARSTRRVIPVCLHMFDTTPTTVRSTFVAEGRDRPTAQRTKGNMRDWFLIRNLTLKLTTPTWRLAICALLRGVLLDRDYQERKNASPNKGSSLQ